MKISNHFSELPKWYIGLFLSQVQCIYFDIYTSKRPKFFLKFKVLLRGYGILHPTVNNGTIFPLSFPPCFWNTKYFKRNPWQQKKWSFLLSNSSVNVTKPQFPADLVIFAEKNTWCKTSFFVLCLYDKRLWRNLSQEKVNSFRPCKTLFVHELVSRHQ